jgi:diaminopimelate decarboxylase
VARLFAEQGCGFDVVSGGELFRALRAGADPRRIVYSGVGKTEREIAEALDAGILFFNVESLQELARLDTVAGRLGKRAPVAIRVNPNVDAKTHPYITTGLRENKFGMDAALAFEAYRAARALRYVQIVGIDCHIGSQLLDIAPFADAAVRLAEMIEALRREGFELRYVDVGGGLGIRYRESDAEPSVAEYAAAILGPLGGLRDLTLVLEPGRFLAGPAGILVSRVQYVKQNTAGKTFAIVDTGMHHLIRPPLYGGHHDIVPVSRTQGAAAHVDVVGPICESSDFLAKDRPLGPVSQGDLLATLNAGAYGIVLASHYNSHPVAAEVLVDGAKFRLIRERESYEDLLRHERW